MEITEAYVRSYNGNLMTALFILACCWSGKKLTRKEKKRERGYKRKNYGSDKTSNRLEESVILAPQVSTPAVITTLPAQFLEAILHHAWDLSRVAAGMELMTSTFCKTNPNIVWIQINYKEIYG